MSRAVWTRRGTESLDHRGIDRREETADREQPDEDHPRVWARPGGRAGDDYAPVAANRARNKMTALEWIWETRLSVTPRTSPISARVIPSL